MGREGAVIVGRAALLGALVSIAAGCSRSKPVKGSTPSARPDSSPSSTSGTEPRVSPSETVLTGKVVAGGLAATPTTSLQIEGGKPMTLVGPLEAELQRLGGATVWVTGAPGTGAPNATFVVSRYEIVSIDGAKPVVGHVMARDGATWIATDRDTLRLTNAPAELSKKAGAKVWVVGRRAGKELATQTYGIIREP